MSAGHEILRRVGYDGHYFLIVPDHAAGKRNRFTVYKIPSSPSRRIKVVGRELTLAHARRIAGISPPKKAVAPKSRGRLLATDQFLLDTDEKLCRHDKPSSDYCDYC